MVGISMNDRTEPIFSSHQNTAECYTKHKKSPSKDDDNFNQEMFLSINSAGRVIFIKKKLIKEEGWPGLISAPPTAN
jgi:hypothetical protein